MSIKKEEKIVFTGVLATKKNSIKSKHFYYREEEVTIRYFVSILQ